MNTGNAPWYRHPWPWIIMSGPAIVVVAGLWTAVLAVRTNDSLVTEDYYRQGMTVNRALVRERHATDIGLGASLAFAANRIRIELSASAPASAGLELSLVHPARAADDESILLIPLGGGVYEGTLRNAPRGVSRIVLEDREGAWRLEGAMRDAPASTALGSTRS